jgi:hypothetical protein
MRLYSGTTTSLIDDSTYNRISDKLADAFFYHFRYKPPTSEVNAWRNSLRAVSQVFEAAELLNHGVLLELQLPHSSKRLDCLVTGHDASQTPCAVIIELKQWEESQESSGENEVVSFVGGQWRDLPHPSAQVGQYKMYLEDGNTAFEPPNAINLHACAYLHNYVAGPGDPLRAPKFSNLIATYPLFTSDDVDDFSGFMKGPLAHGDDGEVRNRIEGGKYRASKKLLDHVANVIEGKPEYILLDEQLVVFDQVLASTAYGCKGKGKTVLIVKGGPGTGKSVIAMNLIGRLSREGYNAHYVTGSKAFTENLRKRIGSRGSVQFNFFSSYQNAEYNSVDALVCDESHRMWKVSRTGLFRGLNKVKSY